MPNGGLPPQQPNAFAPREGYYPNPVPMSGLAGDAMAAITELGRYTQEELEQIQSRMLGITGNLPLPLQGTDALIIGRGDEIYTIDLWEYYFSLLALAGFYDAPDDILAVTAVPTDITGWPSQISSFHFDTPPDPVAGIITVPEAGLYRITCKIIWLQPSITQNFSYLLHIDGSVGGNVIFDAVDVNSNQTEVRALGGSAIFGAAENEQIKLQLSATGTPGLADFQRCSFELEMVAPNVL